MVDIGGALTALFGDEKMARQFFVWSVCQQLVGAVLGPYFDGLTNEVNQLTPLKPIQPADLADMVVRGVRDMEGSIHTAALSGVSADDFAAMVKNTGEPPSIEDMLLLFRRGKVDKAAVEKAVKQSRVRDEWLDTIFMLGVQPPSPADVIDATLKGQIDDAAGAELYQKLGGDPEYFKLMLDTVGDAPSPDQAASMARRGIIPWSGIGADQVTYEQAVREGHYRNKWTDAFKAAAQYQPPPRTITAMHTSGAIDTARATSLLKQAGVPDVLIGDYLKDSSATKKQKHRDLAESTISQLFQDHAIGDAEAQANLVVLGYSPDDANFVILTWTMARELQARKTAVNTVHSKYIGHHIDESQVSNTLDRLGVPANERDTLIATWQEEKAANVTLLTAAEIKKAWQKQLISDADVLDRLAKRGYTDEDAQIFLNI